MNNPYTIIHQTKRQRVSDGMTRSLLENCENAPRILVLVWSQLGDFDTLEYTFWLQREELRPGCIDTNTHCSDIIKQWKSKS